MDEQIIPVDAIRAKAHRQYHAGVKRDEHKMNWHSAALPTWLAEWDRCAKADAERKLAERRKVAA